MSLYKENLPLASTGHSWSGTTVPHDTDASYGDFLRPGTDTGGWASGADLQRAARSGVAVVNLGVIAAGATDFKVALMVADDADGTNGAEDTVLLTLGNTALGTGKKVYLLDVDFVGLDATKFYALSGASKGATPATDGVPFSATLVYLDSVYSG